MSRCDFKAKGAAILQSNKTFPETGRFIPNQKAWMDRTYISDASSICTEGRCVAMYRIKNKLIDSKNVAEVRLISTVK